MQVQEESNQESLRTKQLRVANANMPRIAIVGFIIALVFASVIVSESAQDLVWHWLFLQAIISVFRVVTSLYLQKADDFAGALPLTLVTSGLFFSGVIWSSGLFLLGDNPSEFSIYGTLLIFSGLIAASGITTSMYLPAYYVFLTPLLVISIAWFEIKGIQISNEMQLFAVIYVTGIQFFTYSIYKQFKDHILVSSKNAELADHLNKANKNLEDKVEENSRRERALKNSEAQLRMMFEAIPDGALFVDVTGKIVFANKSAEEIFGYVGMGLTHRCVEDLLPVALGDIHAKLRKDYIASPILHTIKMNRNKDIKAQREDGSTFPADIGVFPTTLDGQRFFAAIVRDLSDQVYMEGLHKEVVERKKAEDRLRQVLKDHEMLTSAVQDVMFHLDLKGRVIWANPALQKYLGMSLENLNGNRLIGFIDPRDAKEFEVALGRLLEGKEMDFELRMSTQYGVRYFHFRGIAVRNDEGAIIRLTGIGRDVTARRITEEQLKESKRRFEISQEFSNVGTWEWNLVSGEMYWSAQFFRNAGISSKNYLPTKWKYFASVAKEDRKRFLKAILGCIKGVKKIDVKHRVMGEDGELRWLRMVGDAEVDFQGRACRLLGVLIDVDDVYRVEEEQRLLKLQLLQSQKMESIGLLTGGIAHDFNNMLTSIMGYSKLLSILTPEEEKLLSRDYLGRIVTASERASELVNQLLSFSREKPESQDMVELHEETDKTINMIAPILPSSIEIRKEFRCDTAHVLGSAVQLQQSLMNLCINARDAMEGKGVLTIRLSEVENFTNVCNSCFKTFSGDYVLLEIEDDGAGIPAELSDRIFDPFMTTKDVGKGSGMGLSMVHGIVHQHGGHINVDSQPGKTRFQLYIPRAITVTELKPVEVSEMERTNMQASRILVVDDEEPISELFKLLLEHYGHVVTTLNDPEVARTLLRKRASEFDLLITDYTMPKITGAELAQYALKVCPEMKIIMCTGYSDHMDKAKALELGIKEFLMKPVDHKKLIDAVQNQLMSTQVTTTSRAIGGGV